MHCRGKNGAGAPARKACLLYTSRTERRRVRPKNDGASRARIPPTNAEKKGSLAMNAMIYKKKGPLVLFLVQPFLFLTMYLYLSLIHIFLARRRCAPW